eukprot:15430483-Alexandrium_andersonii.AAC.1
MLAPGLEEREVGAGIYDPRGLGRDGAARALVEVVNPDPWPQREQDGLLEEEERAARGQARDSGAKRLW